MPKQKIFSLVLISSLLLAGCTHNPISPSPTPSSNTMPAPAAQLPSDWQTYTDAQENFQISHPPDLEVTKTADGFVQFYKAGPTQEENTEIYDAVSLRIREQSKEANQELDKLSQQMVDRNEGGISEVIQTPQPVSINSRNGFKFITQGLGTYEHILLLGLTDETYYHLINGTVDPTGQGFDQILEQMLSTFEPIQTKSQSTGQSGGCAVSGCSSQLCVDASKASDAVSTCEYKEEYACYKHTVCEKQNDGKCGWTSNQKFEQCLQNAPSASL